MDTLGTVIVSMVTAALAGGVVSAVVALKIGHRESTDRQAAMGLQDQQWQVQRLDDKKQRLALCLTDLDRLIEWIANKRNHNAPTFQRLMEIQAQLRSEGCTDLADAVRALCGHPSDEDDYRQRRNTARTKLRQLYAELNSK